MKSILKLTFLIALLWSPSSKAYLDCNQMCPISFAPSESSDFFQGHRDRQNCLSRCQHENSQASELEEQREEQEDLESENEELRQRIEDLEDQ